MAKKSHLYKYPSLKPEKLNKCVLQNMNFWVYLWQYFKFSRSCDFKESGVVTGLQAKPEVVTEIESGDLPKPSVYVLYVGYVEMSVNSVWKTQVQVNVPKHQYECSTYLLQLCQALTASKTLAAINWY